MGNLIRARDVKTFTYDFEYGSCDNGICNPYNRNHLEVQEIKNCIKKDCRTLTKFTVFFDL